MRDGIRWSTVVEFVPLFESSFATSETTLIALKNGWRTKLFRLASNRCWRGLLSGVVELSAGGGASGRAGVERRDDARS